MSGFARRSALALIAVLVFAAYGWAQGRTAYVGYMYPAGGCRGTTFEVRLGGQRLAGVYDAIVTGTGVTAKVTRYYRRMGNQEMSLLREQLRELRRQVAQATKAKKRLDRQTQQIIQRIEDRMAEWVNRPACAAHTELVFLEVTIAPDAPLGKRELRLVTGMGVTNPMVFYVGQVPETVRKPMKTCVVQVLGKEWQALRNRPEEEAEMQITLPCTMNGQIAPGEVNRYRFQARKGQRLVITVKARELIPYIADAVPGWFQPVVTIFDAEGNELAFNDDFRFKPDPTLLFEVPHDGQYVLTITDALFRGREDFVYRITIGELPFVTGVFPLGAPLGKQVDVKFSGWNLELAHIPVFPEAREPGIYRIAASTPAGRTSNFVPFAIDTLPECFDTESNDDPLHAQRVQMPTIVNGRIDRPGDWDVFQVRGRAGQTIVAEVYARRLDSPVDSLLKLTDAKGNLLAANDDHDDPGSGLNTHHADSYLIYDLPADGTYYIHLGDTAHAGGEDYGYRLRISPPRPDFELRVVPSSVSLRSRGTAVVTVYAIRKDRFDGPIALSLKNPPPGIEARPVTLPAGKESVRMTIRTTLRGTKKPFNLRIEGRAKAGGTEIAHLAVPAEDRMQAFLWRHLVPAEQLATLVHNAAVRRSNLERVAPMLTEELLAKYAPKKTGQAPKFTKRQVAARLRQLKLLYEEGYLTDDFYLRKAAECETIQ